MSTITHTSSFFEFADERLGRGLLFSALESVETVDACLDAMQDGTLHVCAVSEIFGNYRLWETMPMSIAQWERLCGLLQRSAVPSSVVWNFKSRSLLFRVEDSSTDYKWGRFLLKRPELVGIDYLWEDLDAVRQFLERWDKKEWPETEVFRCEIKLRQSWAQGLRRAWLVALLV
jgi:hypothetical protein